jgi:hypothetical protein
MAHTASLSNRSKNPNANSEEGERGENTAEETDSPRGALAMFRFCPQSR